MSLDVQVQAILLGYCPTPSLIIALVKDENGDIKVKIQQLLQNDELPRNFRSVHHNSMQLWMTNNVFVITLSQIISKVSVWFEDTEEPFFYVIIFYIPSIITTN